jgi:LPS export ABC transporter protein LptC
MRTFKRLAFILLLIALFVELLVLFPNQIKRENQASQLNESQKPKSPAKADQYMRDVHLVESQQGARDWELFADKARGNKVSGQWDMELVKVMFYSKNDLQFTVSSKTGGLENENKDIRFEGEVEVRSPKGYLFKTQEVRYQSRNRELVSETPVRLQGPKDDNGSGLQIIGKKMKLAIDTNEMTLDGGVAATKQYHGDKLIQIHSAKSILSSETNEVSFVGNAKFDYDHMQIESPSVRMIFGSRSELVKVLYEGGVSLSGQNRKATSEALAFDFVSNTLRFTGKPRLVQGGDELHGDEIIFLDGGRRVKVEKVKASVKQVD